MMKKISKLISVFLACIFLVQPILTLATTTTAETFDSIEAVENQEKAVLEATQIEVEQLATKLDETTLSISQTLTPTEAASGELLFKQTLAKYWQIKPETLVVTQAEKQVELASTQAPIVLADLQAASANQVFISEDLTNVQISVENQPVVLSYEVSLKSPSSQASTRLFAFQTLTIVSETEILAEEDVASLAPTVSLAPATPEVEAPEAEIPEVEVPEIQQPETEAPEVEVTVPEAPKVETTQPNVNQAQTITPLAVVGIESAQTIEPAKDILGQVIIDTYEVTLTATNNTNIAVTNSELDLNIMGDYFTLVSSDPAVTPTINNININGTNFGNIILKWTGITLAANGGTITHKFRIKLRTDVNLPFGEINVYNPIFQSEPTLKYKYNDQDQILNYGHRKVFIPFETSTSATCDIEAPKLIPTKEANEVEGSNDLFDIKLAVDGPETLAGQKADIVIVIDRSGSMFDAAEELKKSLNILLETLLLPNKTNVRVAIVNYATVAKIETTFTSDLTVAKAALENTPFLQNNTIWVPTNGVGYMTVTGSNNTYEVKDIVLENGVPKTATFVFAGVSYPITNIFLNKNRDYAFTLPAAVNTDALRDQFNFYTNTESGLIEAERLLQQSNQGDSCRQKYLITFSDGEPNRRMQTNSLGNPVLQSGTVSSTQDAKAAYLRIVRSLTNLSAQSVGFFTEDSNNIGFDFMYYIQNDIGSPATYQEDNFTTEATELTPIFTKLADKIKDEIFNGLARNLLISDIVTPQFELAADRNYRYEGLTPTQVTESTVTCINSDTNVEESCDKIIFDYSDQTLTTTGMSITFRVKVRNDYYGNAEVKTNVEAKLESWENPYPPNNQQGPQLFPVPEVAVPFVEGQISVLKDVEGEAIVPESILFDIFLKGSGNVLTG
ncbi:MAG: VWA domain-containing protein, partial [Culicoidibacterales bacterium]